MKDNEYKCDVCHGVFKKGWSDKKARKEEAKNFGGNDPDAGIVCDDCYKKMFPIQKKPRKMTKAEKKDVKLVSDMLFYSVAFGGYSLKDGKVLPPFSEKEMDDLSARMGLPRKYLFPAT